MLKRRFSLALLFFTVAQCAAPYAALAPSVFTASGTPIRVAAGDYFLIALASNPTTGYSWSLPATSGAPVQILGSSYQAPTSGRMGAAGQQMILAHAARAGTGTLSFAYRRPWEHGKPARVVTFAVVVSVAH